MAKSWLLHAGVLLAAAVMAVPLARLAGLGMAWGPGSEGPVPEPAAPESGLPGAGAGKGDKAAG